MPEFQNWNPLTTADETMEIGAIGSFGRTVGRSQPIDLLSGQRGQQVGLSPSRFVGGRHESHSMTLWRVGGSKPSFDMGQGGRKNFWQRP